MKTYELQINLPYHQNLLEVQVVPTRKFRVFKIGMTGSSR